MEEKMNILRPLKPIQTVRNGVFLAGPSPRAGKDYNDPCDWRQEAIKLFEEKGFDGDIIDPVNRNFDKDNLRTQVEWESVGLRLASAIIFWIPRSEEHPALTTNIEFGEWFDNPTTFVGFPKEAINNDYLRCRCDAIAKPVFNTLEELVDAVIEYFNAPAKWFATSDTHFGAERTLELSRRPFRNVGEMDLTLISNWNKTVRSKDTIIHLGDFGDRNILRLLNFSKMVFLKGNYENMEENFGIADPRVQIVPHGTSIEYSGKTYFLTHEPLHKGNDEDKFYLYGHIHRLQIVKKNGINVGTDCYRFTPIDFDEIEFLRGGIENHFDDNVFTDAVYDKHDEALKEAYRELKEKAENATWGERYLDEVAEAASEQRAKATEWCKQQIEEATAKNKSKVYRRSSGLREFLDTITDLDWAEIATRHRERCKRAEEANK